MENASKALIMAGGVLIAILLLSIFAYLFKSMSEDTAAMYEQLEASEITKFNQQFLNYQGRTDLTIQDVITIVNLAKDNNENQKRPTFIDVYVDGINWADDDSFEDQLIGNIDTKYKWSDVKFNANNLVKTIYIIAD